MPKLYIVMYHYVRNLKYSRFPELKGLDLELFKEQIKFLKNNFNIIRMEDVIAYYTENYVLPENAVLLTFDDGYSDNYLNVFPILQEEKLQGSFFIPAKTFIEHQVLDVNKVHFVKRLLQTVLPEKLRNRIASNMFDKYVGLSEEKFAYELYVNYEQIKCMKRAGMYIGIHGYNHYWLGNLEVEKMQKDIKRALEVMGDMVVSDSWVMNYPYGSYNDEVISYIKDKGCVLGLTTDVKIADLSADNRYLLPRLDTNDFPPKSENYTKIH